MSEFTIGSQWKTRGGWRAVVVTDAANGKNLCSWQNSCRDGSIKYHNEKGVCYKDPDYDLIEPWPEPHIGTVWVHVRVNEGGDYVDWHAHSKEFPAYKVGDKCTTIAKKRWDWIEGEGL